MNRIAAVIAAAVIAVSSTAFCAEPARAPYLLTLSGAIGPVTAHTVEAGIARAEKEGAGCLIISLDTPGGLAESMRRIVQTLLAARVPVVVYVAPGGARAASAGVMITMAADVAAMAPGTNIGAAHPVGAGGQEISETMSAKVTNDMVAHARSVAQRRGRNADWVEKAIRDSVSITETEALKSGVIDLVAQDMDDLIAQLNGRPVAGKGVMHLDAAARVRIEEDLRTRILKVIGDPNIAYILMMVGLAGLYFELSHPGAVFPGVVGGVSLVLAFFAMQTLPVNIAGLLLVALAVIFFVLEMKITSYGMLSVAGIVAMALGSLMLYDAQGSQLRVAWQVLVPTLAVVCGFFVTVAALVFKAQVARPQTGAGGLVGQIGSVRTAVAPEGKVFIHGELWQARARHPIAAGTRARVIAVEGLVLIVEGAEPDSLPTD